MSRLGDVEVVVIAARREEAYAVQSEFKKHSDASYTDEDTRHLRDLVVHHFKIPGKSEHLAVGHSYLEGMGNIESAARTAQLIEHYRPVLVLFVGIAGSLDPERARIGDVFLPQTVKTRFYNKIKDLTKESFKKLTADERRETFMNRCCKLDFDFQEERITAAARKLIAQIPVEHFTNSMGNEDLPTEWKERKLYLGRRAGLQMEETSFSWEKVISSNSYVKFLRTQVGRAPTCVDMESYGFLKAVNALYERPGAIGLIVRGISDYAQDKITSDGETKWRDLAKRNAAKVARMLIQEVYPNYSRGHYSKQPTNEISPEVLAS
jgi:nucleoside phosphorylase